MAQGITDSSASDHQLTANGAAFIDTAQAKFGNRSLNVIGSGASVKTASSPDFNFGAGQFTFEAWVYWTAHTGTAIEAFQSQWGTSGTTNSWWLGMLSGTLELNVTPDGSTMTTVGAAYTPTLNTWTHIAADRDASNVVRVYANGVVIASSTVAMTLYASAESVYAGSDVSGYKLTGYMDELRVSNTARYGGAFTPPTSAFSPDASTVLLVHFDALNGAAVGRKVPALQPAFALTVPPAAVLQLGKAPTPGPHTVSGTVQVNGVPTAGLLVRAYAKATGEFLGQTTTDGSGNYTINCGNNFTDVTVVAYNPPTYEALVADQITPA